MKNSNVVLGLYILTIGCLLTLNAMNVISINGNTILAITLIFVGIRIIAASGFFSKIFESIAVYRLYAQGRPSFKNQTRALPAFIAIFIHSLIPIVFIIIYYYWVASTLTRFDFVILMVLGIMVSFVLCSLLRSPGQFLVALIERIAWPFILIAALLIRLLALFQSTINFVARISLRGLRLLLVIIGATLYAIIPIDLIPDIVPIIGWLDDVGVALVSLRWGLYVSKFAINIQLREKAIILKNSAKIVTPFP